MEKYRKLNLLKNKQSEIKFEFVSRKKINK